MSDKFYLDENGFRSFSNDLGDVGSDLQAAQRELSTTLEQYTGAWGSDEIGKAFEKNYWADSEELRIGVGDAGEGIVETADSAQKSAENLASVDEETAEWMDSQTTE